jgi:uncharacterized protein (DUF2062 family)
MSTVNGSEVSRARPGQSWVRRRLVEPLQSLLGGGVAPAALAWALAVGALIGSMPLAWGTTLLCVGAALLFRLHPLAVQVGNLVAWPLQLLLAYPYCRLGTTWFGSAIGTAGTDPSAGLPGHLVRSIVAANGAALRAWALTAPLLLPLLYAAGYRLVAFLHQTEQ